MRGTCLGTVKANGGPFELVSRKAAVAASRSASTKGTHAQNDKIGPQSGYESACTHVFDLVLRAEGKVA